MALGSTSVRDEHTEYSEGHTTGAFGGPYIRGIRKTLGIEGDSK
jgi:hypothetical protein